VRKDIDAAIAGDYKVSCTTARSTCGCSGAATRIHFVFKVEKAS